MVSGRAEEKVALGNTILEGVRHLGKMKGGEAENSRDWRLDPDLCSSESGLWNVE